MKTLMILISLAGTALSQNCQSKQEAQQVFSQYLNCIKGQLDADYQGYEQELQGHHQRAVSSCFASSIATANSQARCVMTLQDLENTAWSKQGPLRECSICRTFANAAIKAVLKTSQQEQKCFREEVTKAVVREANFCLGPSSPGISNIPDMEAGSFNFQQMIVAFCSERKPDRARSTEACLKNPFAGFMAKHCQLVRQCDAGVPGACQGVFGQTKGAICRCIDTARVDLKQRIGSIAQVIRQTIQDAGGPSIGASSTADRCVNNIKAQMVTPSNDWLAVLNNAMTRCLRNRPSKSLTVESMLRVGCRKVISETKSRGSASSESQLKSGFDFINNLIDAFVDRAKRFCGGPHCA